MIYVSWTYIDFTSTPAENEMSSICTMDPSDAVRMGCIPHIAVMCKKAIDFKATDDSQSLESFSSSAVGYMSEALISQSWPNLSSRAPGVSRDKSLTLLSCLGRAPRLPRKDWTACLRRCLRLYPKDGDVHEAVVRFACQRAAVGTLDNLRDFVITDIFNLNNSIFIQSMDLVEEAQYLALENLHLLVRYLSHEERSKIITSLLHMFPPEKETSCIQLAHAVCCGLHSIVRECSDSMKRDALDVMVQILYSTMDCSFASMAMLCSLYPLDNNQLSARIDDDRSEDSIIDTIRLHTDIGALVIAAYRIASPEMQKAFCQSTLLFAAHPELHTWVSCALMSSIDVITATNQLRNYIMREGSDIDIVSRILAEGFRSASKTKGPSMTNEALAWMTTLVGTHHTSGIVPKGPMHTAIMCLVGVYAAQTKDWSLSLSFESARLVLPKALEFFMQRHEDMFTDLSQIFIDLIYNL